MKFVQLIEYSMRNIFLEKLHTNCSVEVSPRTFDRKSKLSISLDQQPEMLKSDQLALPDCIYFLIYWQHIY